jgi:hypothetical protein
MSIKWQFEAPHVGRRMNKAGGMESLYMKTVASHAKNKTTPFT